MGDDAPFHNPFGALAHLRGAQPAKPSADPTPEPRPRDAPARRAAPSPTPAIAIARAVVRMERSGRGGKTVTVVEQLHLKPSDLERWLKDLKGALGCGGVVEGDALVLQGDQRKRLPDLLAHRGVKRVTVS